MSLARSLARDDENIGSRAGVTLVDEAPLLEPIQVEATTVSFQEHAYVRPMWPRTASLVATSPATFRPRYAMDISSPDMYSVL